MALHDWFLLCFAVGTLWSVASVALGHSGHAHAHHSAAHSHFFGAYVHPSTLAAFLAWFGGVGYLLTRHTGWRFWADLLVAAAAGLAGASLLGSFLHFLQSRDHPLDPADYRMAGVLGRVSSAIRVSGVGEVIYIRDGARKLVPARSEDGTPIARDEEVIVTRYERGIAYVRTWAAMVSPSPLPGWSGEAVEGEALQREKEDVE